MRRFVPWSLLVLLTLGVVVGAILGTSRRSAPLSAQARIAEIIAATTGSPSARFTYSTVTKSSNPVLRSRESGTGEVNFATNSMRDSERRQATQWVESGGVPSHPVPQTTLTNEIQIGRQNYMEFSTGTVALGTRWIKGSTFPAGSMGPFGALGQIGPLASLAMNESVTGLQVKDLGSATTAGRPTTRLLFSLPSCLAVGRARGMHTLAAPTEVWVDAQDRLVRVTTTTREEISKSAFTGPGLPRSISNPPAGFPTGRSTITQTVRLDDFDAPVSITAPPVTPIDSSSGSGFIVLRRRGCSS